MSGEQWKAVYDLFEAASNLPAAERRQFAAAATSDPEVRNELLAMLDEAPTPTIDAAPPEPEWRRLGQQVGRFTITNALGRGGMGEVYSAHDAELDRTVALKFLAFETSGDGRTAERFIREARAASALNHPNIVTVHEVVRLPPTIAIVMEMVEGVPLRQRCGKRNPVEEVVHWGRQIAEALAAAHAAGIVHRDIKPENVMLRPDGYTKVLDFGLARQFSQDQSSASITAGTFRYMSPEQTRGAKLTAATDVFSLGIMLYELATGAHPFAGESPLETAHYISSRDAAPPSVSKSFDALILSMLRKSPEERPPAAQVARRLAQLTADPGDATAKRKVHRGLWWAAALVAVMVPVLVVLAINQPGTSKQPAPQSEAKKLWGAPLTDLAGHQGDPAFSPDGSRVAYAWDRADDSPQRDIFVKRIGTGDPERITGDEADESSPEWSADGTQLAFLRHSATDLKVVVAPVAGGAERVVGSLDPEGPLKPRLTWSPDGQSLVVSDHLPGQSNQLHLFRLHLRGGERTLLTKPAEGSDVAPVYSPDGKTLAFLRSQNVTESRLYVLDANGRERQVTRDTAPIDSFAWNRDGTGLTYAAGLAGSKDLWRAALDGSTPERLGFVLAGTGVTHFTIAPVGNRIAYTVRYKDSNIWRIDTTGSTRPRKLTIPEAEDEDAAYSPDGTQFAFTSRRSGLYDIWAGNADGSHQRPLTTEGVFAGSAVWSPDGSHVAYDARIGGFSEIWMVSAQGGKPKRVIEPPVDAIVPFWSRDGRWVYFCAHLSGSAQIWKVPSGGGKPVQVTRHGGFEGRESFDGKYLYYSKPGEMVELWRTALAGGGEEKITEIGSLGPYRYWDVTSKGIYFVRAKPKPMLHFFDFETRRIADIATPPKPPAPGWRGLSAAPDGKSVLYVQYDADRHEIVIADDFR